jgi:hypothetical protein
MTRNPIRILTEKKEPMMNNRNFSPSSQQFQRPRPDMSAYAPPRILMGLIGQSEKRYMFLREAAMKLDAGFGDLGIVFEGQPLDPIVQQGLENLFALADIGKQQLENEMKFELHLQGELKRFLMGRPPSALVRRPAQPPQLSQGSPPGSPYYAQQMPPPGYGPQQQQQQMPQQPIPQQIPPEMMAPPTGPIDYRDPKQAAAALLRAQPMPLHPTAGPGGMQPQQGLPQQMYVPPGAYGVPQPQAAYGVPPGAYAPPLSQVPVVAGAPETATQIMEQSRPQPQPQQAMNVPAPVPQASNGTTKNATS